MPTVQVPLQSWNSIPRLARSREFQRLAAEKIALKQQTDRVKVRLDGDDEQNEQGLSAELYLLMDELLPEGVKSVEFEGYMLTKDDGGPTKTLSKKLLMQRALPCTGCKECKRKKIAIYVTAADLEACYEEGTRKPTVKAEKIKEKAAQSGSATKPAPARRTGTGR